MEDNTWVWPSICQTRPNQLIFKSTGYQGDVHWTGTLVVARNDKTFEFWRWLSTNSKALPLFLEERKIRAGASSRFIDTSLQLTSPAEGLFLLPDAYESEPAAVEALQTIFVQKEIQARLHLVSQSEADGSVLWNTIRLLSDDKCFYYHNSTCTFSSGFGPQRENLSFELTQIEELLSESI